MLTHLVLEGGHAAGSHVAPFAPTCNTAGAETSATEAQPAHLFWSHTPPNQTSWGQGGCWEHHGVVPSARTALSGQIHTDASEENTMMSLGGSPSSLVTEGVEWLFSTYQQGRSYRQIYESFSSASYTRNQLSLLLQLVGLCMSTRSLWAWGFVPSLEAPCALQALHIFPTMKSPEQMRNPGALRQSECGFLPKGIPQKQEKML